jgi:hypothetical protein
MNIRNLRNRFVSPMLAVGIVGTLVGLDAHSVSAQSITVITPFSFCVNHQAYPNGRYRFTLISQWILSVQNVNGEDESFFQIRREDGNAQGVASSPMTSAGGVTFRTFQDGICLAGSVLDNLQGFGLGQKEQLFEEFGGGPELLAASL